MYLNSEGDVIKGLSLESYLASGIPGTVAGLIQLHKDEASMPLEKLIAPAIVLANEGFQLSDFQVSWVNGKNKKPELKDKNIIICSKPISSAPKIFRGTNLPPISFGSVRILYPDVVSSVNLLSKSLSSPSEQTFI